MRIHIKEPLRDSQKTSMKRNSCKRETSLSSSPYLPTLALLLMLTPAMPLLPAPGASLPPSNPNAMTFPKPSHSHQASLLATNSLKKLSMSRSQLRCI